MADILTAAGQLVYASEFRFDYWRLDSGGHRFYSVRKGRGHNDGRWAICDGGESGAYWDGTEWNASLRGPSAYRYELEDALKIAKRLAFEENQRWVGIMEAKFPGTIRGGSVDMAAKGSK